MANAKHTPGPWRIEYRTPKLYFDRDIVVLGPTREIADVIGSDGVTMDNARFIVRACNNHETLLAACKRARDSFREVDALTWANELVHQLEAAIAAAEGD